MKLFGNLFLSVGAMKAGTTWLYAVLSHHPELHFTPEKEIHYFFCRYSGAQLLSDETRLKNVKEKYLPRIDPKTSSVDRTRLNLRWMANYLDRPVDDLWYSNLFHTNRTEKYACDFSNLTCHIPTEAWPRIKSECRKLRVLYTMRDPIKRLWSHTKFHLQVTGELDKLDNWERDDFERFVRKQFIWDNAEYGVVIRNLKQGLEADDWMAVFYEDIHENQIDALRQIEAFLGVEAFDYPKELLQRRFTESVSRPMPDFFAEIFSDDVNRIKNEIEAEGFQIPSSWT